MLQVFSTFWDVSDAWHLFLCRHWVVLRDFMAHVLSVALEQIDVRGVEHLDVHCLWVLPGTGLD